MDDVALHGFVQRGVLALERMAAALEAVVNPTPVDLTAIHGNCPHCGAPEEKQVEAGNLTTGPVTKCLVCQTEYQAA